MRNRPMTNTLVSTWSGEMQDMQKSNQNVLGTHVVGAAHTRFCRNVPANPQILPKNESTNPSKKVFVPSVTVKNTIF